MLSYPKCKVFSVAEAYWPDPPSPTAKNFLSFIRSSLNCQSFGHSAKNCKSKQKCLVRGECHSHKGCPNNEAEKPKCAICKGLHVASYKGCPEYKRQAFGQHVVNNQKSYAAAVGQNTLTQPKTSKTFSFTAEQLTKFVANVVIQIAQPQVCYPNPKQDMLDLKFSMCRKILIQPKRFSVLTLLGRTCLNPSVLKAPPAPPPPQAIHIHEY